VWAGALLAFRYMSLASILGALAFPIHLTWFGRSEERTLVLVAIAWFVGAAIVLRHRSNLARLARGQERRFEVKKT
jgi:glycerol-3-phosphate acyltransferase PlsY